ncbi:c-type cytochrome [Amaricoccus solimangrovi]|uniref:Cytochrome c n=1 Tax=Amaricoccus solimangrovi TaxID=2589815 RepID=A0A501WSI5_9RHOB|nr:cytochrome c [Amaricoccus solimangrovi]TPE51054.1 cytochrome c [Amaricoccus solimangrovi]
MRRATLLLLALAACEMADQPRYDAYEPAPLFPNGASVQPPPEGAVARGYPARAATLATRPPLTPALLDRGRERYAIACVPCHGIAGDGDGVVPSRGFPPPPSFAEPRLRAAPAATIVDVITHGHGVMYSYADRVAPADRWAIAAYVRALQTSLGTPAADLPEADRAKLAEAGR